MKWEQIKYGGIKWEKIRIWWDQMGANQMHAQDRDFRINGKLLQFNGS